MIRAWSVTRLSSVLSSQIPKAHAIRDLPVLRMHHEHRLSGENQLADMLPRFGWVALVPVGRAVYRVLGTRKRKRIISGVEMPLRGDATATTVPCAS